MNYEQFKCHKYKASDLHFSSHLKSQDEKVDNFNNFKIQMLQYISIFVSLLQNIHVIRILEFYLNHEQTFLAKQNLHKATTKIEIPKSQMSSYHSQSNILLGARESLPRKERKGIIEIS